MLRITYCKNFTQNDFVARVPDKTAQKEGIYNWKLYFHLRSRSNSLGTPISPIHQLKRNLTVYMHLVHLYIPTSLSKSIHCVNRSSPSLLSPTLLTLIIIIIPCEGAANREDWEQEGICLLFMHRLIRKRCVKGTLSSTLTDPYRLHGR